MYCLEFTLWQLVYSKGFKELFQRGGRGWFPCTPSLPSGVPFHSLFGNYLRAKNPVVTPIASFLNHSCFPPGMMSLKPQKSPRSMAVFLLVLWYFPPQNAARTWGGAPNSVRPDSFFEK